MNNDEKIVYFAGAIRGDRSLSIIFPQIVNYVKSLGYLVLTEHVSSEDPVQVFAEKLGKTKETLTAEDIEKQDISWLDQANFVIAEISGASTGTGREIEYARTKGLLGKTPAKILCLYQIEKEYYASPMIRGMDRIRYPNLSVKSYVDFNNVKSIIRDFLQNLD